MRNFEIAGVGMYVPEKILTNEEMEGWGIGVSANWILENSGVKERRIATKQQTSGILGSLAAKDALNNANIKPEEIDLIVMATNTPDYLSPNTSSIVKKNIGAVNAACFDIQAGCAGFVFAFINAVNYGRLNEEINNILVIGADVISRVIDWSNRKLCSIYGDGAGAFVLQRAKGSHEIKQSYIYHECMESVNYSCIPVYYGEMPPESKGYYTFEGRNMYEMLKRGIPITVNKLLEKMNWSTDEVDLYVFTQVNKHLINDVCSALNVSREKSHFIMEKYGYTSTSCIPLSIYDALVLNRITKGNKIVLTGAGGGTYIASVALEWAY